MCYPIYREYKYERKHQNNNTTVIANFEDFILTVYAIINNLYHQISPLEVVFGGDILDNKLFDSEIIAIGICEEMTGIDSEDA